MRGHDNNDDDCVWVSQHVYFGVTVNIVTKPRLHKTIIKQKQNNLSNNKVNKNTIV